TFEIGQAEPRRVLSRGIERSVRMPAVPRERTCARCVRRCRQDPRGVRRIRRVDQDVDLRLLARRAPREGDVVLVLSDRIIRARIERVRRLGETRDGRRRVVDDDAGRPYVSACRVVWVPPADAHGVETVGNKSSTVVLAVPNEALGRAGGYIVYRGMTNDRRAVRDN